MSLEKLRTARCIAGVHQVCKAVQSGAAEAVFIASDADDRVLAAPLAACAAAGIEPDRTAQALTVTAGTLPWQIDTERFTEERDAYVELTAYYVRHPELLIRKEDL